MRLSTEPLEAMGNTVVRLFLATELCQGKRNSNHGRLLAETFC